LHARLKKEFVPYSNEWLALPSFQDCIVAFKNTMTGKPALALQWRSHTCTLHYTFG